MRCVLRHYVIATCPRRDTTRTPAKQRGGKSSRANAPTPRSEAGKQPRFRLLVGREPTAGNVLKPLADIAQCRELIEERTRAEDCLALFAAQ